MDIGLIDDGTLAVEDPQALGSAPPAPRETLSIMTADELSFLPSGGATGGGACSIG